MRQTRPEIYPALLQNFFVAVSSQRASSFLTSLILSLSLSPSFFGRENELLHALLEVRDITSPSRRQDDDVLLEVLLFLSLYLGQRDREREREREEDRESESERERECVLYRYPSSQHDKFVRPLSRTRLNRLRSCVQYCGGDRCSQP